ncbi:peptide-methionine (S)-S-oxide reductase MsrA [Moheibacter sp.]|jgi:peptide-methionine (S)-S-oxide reductase|uniref:peptide-methionine (S)-S-oxide reductase MsrA n=1 Tax=Moheibacter sp. TaxID=1965316 RepID=UPI0016B7028F|nr:peptide-methionine (S)-S-oxide reductase MsrA [Flavobacteriaceae bacterium]
MRLIFIFVLSSVLFSCKGQTDKSKKSNHTEMSSNGNLEKITFGGGCFWCVEAVFDQLLGVETVTSGYAGGHTENPTYKEVCSGTTGHAEVIQVAFDPEIISLDEIFDVFWTVHDPTQLNRQGNDVGTQYRSIILYENEEQKLKAERSIKEYEASEIYDGSFTTQVVPLEKFYTAEDYHQNYYENDGGQNPYCTVVVKPKIDKFYNKFYDKLKPEYK